MYLERGGVLEIPARTLFITGLGRIRRYHTAEDRWRFWWFEFALGGVAPFPLDRVMDIPDSDRDEADMSEMFMDLRREPPLYRGAASALFAAALYRWLAAWEGKRRTTPHRESILRVIDEMHGRLSPPWTVHEMAAFTHLSERRFRQVFFGETGRKPKQFYDELRLSMAGEFLRQGLYSVGEVAARLGFSSPFHFSKAFKRQFGHSPSKVR
ncbi:helix-turn-helix transcriptional regulator [bacterium]|nr:helix-turn-helix transcriptional regulator [bacterium]